jgi:hypothetical protein
MKIVASRMFANKFTGCGLASPLLWRLYANSERRWRRSALAPLAALRAAIEARGNAPRVDGTG